MSDQGFWTVRGPAGEERRVNVNKALSRLKSELTAAFGLSSDPKDYVLTDYTKDFTTDEELSGLSSGHTLWFVHGASGVPPAKERIAFPPHPKTLTHAGDYEYFAAQGQTPFPYALAELIDNSLRATIRGRPSGRRITVSFVLSTAQNPASGLVAVWDNGCGMTKQELNDWAVMNLSMEDRGAQPLEAAVQRGAAREHGAARFLSGNLSYFGVGSKNAAFYLGKRIKVTTQNAGSKYVHELSLSANDLEQRYREGQAVYEDDLVHRVPGDGSTVCGFEEPFPAAAAWVAGERADGGSESFTRVVVGDLKPEVLALISGSAGRLQLCRSLAHLYHYYLHGEKGNAPGEAAERSVDAPAIMLECRVGKAQIWQSDLADVDDDMESLYLRAKKSDFHFSMDVQGKGQVEGVLWYYPFESERETLPVEEFQAGHEGVTHFNLTQQQAAPTQAPTQAPGAAGGSDDEGEVPLWQRARAPLFEAFWQGRLIPGARIESLPFIEAIRSRRGAAAKDVVPDDCFLRLRGALFFGPGFLVTRNKLTFRDNLQELLQTAVKKERSHDKQFREWMAKCHADLDKVVRFECLAPSDLQAEARQLAEREATAFERVRSGSRIVQRGDVIRLAVKPTLVGRVEYFAVNEVVKEEGVFSNGRVAIRPLPEEVFGGEARRMLPLRRMDAVLSDSEIEQHQAKEISKVPATLVLDTSIPETVRAGGDVPEVSVGILTGAKQRVVKGYLGGRKCTFSVTQTLWWCPTENAPEAGAAAEVAPAGPAKKGKRKGRRAAAPTANNTKDAPAENAVLLWEAEVSRPEKDAFRFTSVPGRLERSGRHVLQFALPLPPPATGSVKASAEFRVAPGPPVEFVLQGEGRVAMATADLMLGEWLPDIQLIFKDQFGNPTLEDVASEAKVSVDILRSSEHGKDAASQIRDLEVVFSQAKGADGASLVISSLQVFGPSSFEPGSGPLSIFAEEASKASGSHGTQAGEQAEGSLMRELRLRFGWPGLQSEVVPLRLLPGLPRSLSLRPGVALGEPAEAGGRHYDHVLAVPGGGELPEFQVLVHDPWENPTAPCAEMQYHLTVESEGLDPPACSFPFAPTATVKGLKAAPARNKGAIVPLDCSLVFPNVAEEDVRDIIGGSELPRLSLGLALQPSTAPAQLQLLRDSEPATVEPVISRQQAYGESDQAAAVFRSVEAGAWLRKLAFRCLDEAGNPAACKTGKVQVSWSRGSKKIQLGSEPLGLPDLQAPERVQDAPTVHTVRFTASGGVSLELPLLVAAVPSAPFCWTAEAVDAAGETQGMDDQGNVACGQFFRLEISAADKFNNRCQGLISTLVPTPVVVPQATNADQNPRFDVSEWEQHWTTKADGNEVYSVRMRVGGNPGPLDLVVRDGEGGPPKAELQPDRLEVRLQAGRASCLMFDAPAVLHCGVRSTLGELRIKATDAYDNFAANNIEVMLQPTAVAIDGSGQAASVTAAAGNKVRTKGGTGTFKDVRLVAEQPGLYVLKALPTSREVTGEATLTVKMEPVNAVTAVSLALPDELSTGIGAGGQATVAATFTTEDEQPLPRLAALDGMVVRITAPDEGSRELHAVEPAASEDDDEALAQTFAFSTGMLTAAGQYTINADYTERRPKLAPTRKARGPAISAAALLLTVQPGRPARIALDGQSAPTGLAATNAASDEERLLLKSAAVHLCDEHGNMVAEAGVLVAIALRPRERLEDGAEAPVLAECQPRATDSHGSAFFGDVSIAEGTGRAGGSGEGMDLVLSFRVAEPAMSDCGGWECPVVFSDDKTRFSELQELSKKQAALLAEKAELDARREEACRTAADATAQHERAGKHVAEQQKAGRQLDSAAAVDAALEQLKLRQIGSGEAGTSVDARYGAQDQPMTKALTKCLQAAPKGVLGVFAQLATVAHDGLGRVLAANHRSMLVVLVVEEDACRKAIQTVVNKHRLVMPDVLSLSHALGYASRSKEDCPGWQSAGQLAQSLQHSACSASDLPLPVALPHTRALRAGKRAQHEATSLAAEEWPKGCLGYAFNLVRPVLKGHRAALLYPILGQTLVFETLEEAVAYRTFCTQGLKHGISDIVTLDARRISAKGIISGSSFRVPPLEDATIRFGTASPDQGPPETQAATEKEELEALRDALCARETSRARMEEAQAGKEETEQDVEGRLQQIDGQLADLQAMFGAPTAAEGRRKGKKRATSKQRPGAAAEQENAEPNEAVPGGAAQPSRTKRARLARA